MRADGKAQESLAAAVVAGAHACLQNASQWEPRAAAEDLLVGRRMPELAGSEVDHLMVFASQDVVDTTDGSAMEGRSEPGLHTSDQPAGRRWRRCASAVSVERALESGSERTWVRSRIAHVPKTFLVARPAEHDPRSASYGSSSAPTASSVRRPRLPCLSPSPPAMPRH